MVFEILYPNTHTSYPFKLTQILILIYDLRHIVMKIPKYYMEDPQTRNRNRKYLIIHQESSKDQFHSIRNYPFGNVEGHYHLLLFKDTWVSRHLFFSHILDFWTFYIPVSCWHLRRTFSSNWIICCRPVWPSVWWRCIDGLLAWCNPAWRSVAYVVFNSLPWHTSTTIYSLSQE